MSAQPVHIIATITPIPGKTSRIEELFHTIVINNVWEKEHGTSRYHLHRQIGGRKGNEKLIMIETYDSQKDIEAHAQTPYFKEFGKKLQDEGLLKEPLKVLQCVSIAGFENRKQGLVSKI